MKEDLYEVIENCPSAKEAALRTIFKVGTNAVVSRIHLSSSGSGYVVIPQFSLVPENTKSQLKDQSEEPEYVEPGITDNTVPKKKSSTHDINAYLLEKRKKKQ